MRRFNTPPATLPRVLPFGSLGTELSGSSATGCSAMFGGCGAITSCLMGLGSGIVGLGIVAIIVYFVLTPGAFDQLLDPPPDVVFFPIPTLSETDVKEGRTTILSIIVRNNENTDTVTNIVAKLSVIEGGNPEEHLEFDKLTKLSNSLYPGDVSNSKNISIKAKKLSGEETKFRMQVELLVNQIPTKTHEFDIKIVPNS